MAVTLPVTPRAEPVFLAIRLLQGLARGAEIQQETQAAEAAEAADPGRASSQLPEPLTRPEIPAPRTPGNLAPCRAGIPGHGQAAPTPIRSRRFYPNAPMVRNQLMMLIARL